MLTHNVSDHLAGMDFRHVLLQRGVWWSPDMQFTWARPCHRSYSCIIQAKPRHSRLVSLGWPCLFGPSRTVSEL